MPERLTLGCNLPLNSGSCELVGRGRVSVGLTGGIGRKATLMTESFWWKWRNTAGSRGDGGLDVGAKSHPVAVLGIEEIVTARQSPWQNPYAERVIGSIRRECLDHIVILSERHLKRVLASYADYYHSVRTHLSLGKDTPHRRPIQSPERGNIVELKRVRGLHHEYVRIAA